MKTKQAFIVIEFIAGELTIRAVFSTESKARKYVNDCEEETGNKHEIETFNIDEE